MKKFTLLFSTVIICYYSIAQTQRASVASGNWNTGSTWSGGVVPSSSEQPVISAGHTVTYDRTSGTYAGVVVNGTLNITNSGSHTLISNNKNIVVNGTLNMSVTSYSDLQYIQFSGITESNFVGGGETVLSTDVGLWVTDTGQLNLDGRVSGSHKTYMVHASGSISSGASTISLDQTPVDWKQNDYITIVPTQSPSVGDDFVLGIDTAKLTANVTTASMSINDPTDNPHPKINSTWGAEILNTTRPVRIEGKPNQRAHIFIKSSKVQTIRDVAFSYLGPRKDINSDGDAEFVLGRYGLHFHHSENGSYGSIVDNCVMLHNGSHSFVPHGSHGIIFRRNIAYDCTETPFWWDLGDSTHDITYDSNLVLFPNFVSGSLAFPYGEENPTFAVSAFELGIGDGNIATNNIAIGTYGDPHAGGAFNWESNNEGVWVFKNNISHNCVGGLRVWQNTTKNHVIENYTAYNCIEGIFHGAYANSYRYITGNMYDAPVEIEAGSTHSSRIRFEDYTFNGAGNTDYCVTMVSSPLPGTHPLLFRNCTFSGYNTAGLLDQVANEIHSVDVIQSTGSCVVDAFAHNGETMRLQPTSGTPQKKTKSSTTNISAFAPTVWGDGTGLLGEYYSNTDLTGSLFSRTDSYVGFSEWESGVHHLITDNTYSVRWSGQFQPQFSEPYKFSLGIGGGYKLWIRDTLRLNSWTEHYPTGDSTGWINGLVAGTKYNIKLEFFNEDEHTGVNLYWRSASIQNFSNGPEYIPQSQLWPTMGSPRYTVPEVIPTVQTPEQITEYMVPTLVRDRIMVKSPRAAVYRLYDLTGRLLGNGKISQGVNYIPSGNLRTGMIIMKLNDEKVFKLIKE